MLENESEDIPRDVCDNNINQDRIVPKIVWHTNTHFDYIFSHFRFHLPIDFFYLFFYTYFYFFLSLPFKLKSPLRWISSHRLLKINLLHLFISSIFLEFVFVVVFIFKCLTYESSFTLKIDDSLNCAHGKRKPSLKTPPIISPDEVLKEYKFLLVWISMMAWIGQNYRNWAFLKFFFFIFTQKRVSPLAK